MTGRGRKWEVVRELLGGLHGGAAVQARSSFGAVPGFAARRLGRDRGGFRG